MPAPVCLFVYNRLLETKQAVIALQNNFLAGQTELFIFSDGPKSKFNDEVNKIRKYLQTITGFKSIAIIESIVNRGLANSILFGVSLIFEKYEKVIVLEDDLITTPNFLDFMNQALDYYQEEEKIQSISGYSLSLKDKSKAIYFQTRPGSWGWATWKNRWDKEIFDKKKIQVEINSNNKALKQFKLKCGEDISKMLLDSIHNRNDSWYVRWAFDHFIKDHYSVFPTYSYTQNIGFNPDGTHCKGVNSYASIRADGQHRSFDFEPFRIPNQKTNREFLAYFSRKHKIIVRIKLLKTASGRSLLWNEFKTRTQL
jgi:hypothetical protein